MTRGSHQVCWAHLIRELTFFDQAHTPNDKSAAHPWPEFSELARLASSAIHDRNVSRGSGGEPPGSAVVRSRFMNQLKAAIARITAAAPGRGSTLADGLTLLGRLRRLHADLWWFLEDFDVSATNNGSEQALRVWKVKQCRSGTFRSAEAAKQWLLIGSYLDTCRKHGHTPEQALDAALAGRPFMPVVAARLAA